jgi:N-acyl-D-aspartate/D-glutamate deacylase
MLDCKISGGSVIDGTGAAARECDVGIRAGRIAAVGKVDEAARRTVDARGMIVAPGFVDIHTHYDAQVFWDTTLSPSPLHGVTTVVGGNCGFSIAPLTPEAGEYLMRMLARVEGMPLESLVAGVPWNWRSFGEYLDRIDGTLAVNAGFLVGHSALRRVVMGEAAVGSEANAEQLAAMVDLLHESLNAGGLGFSSSVAPTHNDGDGKPVPSRHASNDELVALSRVLRDHPGTALEFLPGVGEFSDEQKQLMTAMSLAANRPLNWNVLGVASYAPQMHESQLSASDYASERGARVVALTLPQTMTLRLNLVSGFIFDALPGWADVIGLPIEERKRALADPALRRRLDEGANSEEAGVFKFFAAWQNMRIDETFAPENADLVGRTVGEIAVDRGVDPIDAMLDLALSDDLRTSFMPPIPGDDERSWSIRAETWRDPRTVIGASDAGAHLDMIDTFTWSTALLGPAVRDRKLITMEEAIHQLTQVPAELYGIRQRGVLGEGWYADVAVFDPARIGPGPIHTRRDLPAGAARLYAEAEGIEHVFANGVEIVTGKNVTNARPGVVLRSGRDTDTVTVPGGQE